jgi:hypothetical protein
VAAVAVFGVLALTVTGANAAYTQLPEGYACLEGYDIADVETCETAAAAVGVDDSNGVFERENGGVDNANNPSGCYVSGSSLNFNKNQANKNKGLSGNIRLAICSDSCTSDVCGGCAAGNVATSGCSPCDDGKEPNSDQSVCVDCGAGTAGTGGVCSPCGDGKKPNSAKTGCEDCGAGSAGTGGVCSQCGDGKEPNSDQSACVDCGAGTAGTGGVCSQCDDGKEPNSNKTACQNVVLNNEASRGSVALGALAILVAMCSMFGSGKL